MKIETERLIIRDFTVEDAADVFAFNSDPEVMRYTGEKPWTSIETAIERLANYPDYKKYGYGRWAVELKSTQKVIGFCGPKYLEDFEETDLGYRFLKNCWGKGYATESSKVVIDYVFSEIKLAEMVAFVYPKNPNSSKVLDKCGFSFIGAVDYEGDRVFKYLLKNPHSFPLKT